MTEKPVFLIASRSQWEEPSLLSLWYPESMALWSQVWPPVNRGMDYRFRNVK